MSLCFGGDWRTDDDDSPIGISSSMKEYIRDMEYCEQRENQMTNKFDLPEPGELVLALLKFEDVPPMPLVGFMAETSDTHEPYFHCPGNRQGYHPDLVAKWRYLKDIAPDFTIG